MTFTNEIWKPIDVSPFYEVSDGGNIRRVKGYQCSTTRPVKAYLSPSGYLSVSLSNKGKPKTYTVHRLVAKAFLENPDSLLTVNHIDGNPTNNVTTNLEWASQKQQYAHARYVLGRRLGGAKPKTQCHKGHKFTLLNTQIAPDGSKRCRACRRITSNNRYRRLYAKNI